MCKICFRIADEKETMILATFHCQHEAVALRDAVLESFPRIEAAEWLTAEFFEGEWRLTCHWGRLLKTDAAFVKYNSVENNKCWMGDVIIRRDIWNAAVKFLYEGHSEDAPKQKEIVPTLN